MSRGAWPGGKSAAVVFNVAYEAWDDGVAPGLSPMGNPLPPGVVDTQAIEWASYGWTAGIWRLIDVFARHRVRSTVMTSARLAELAPDTVTALVEGGHDVCGHAYAQNILPVMLDEATEREHIARCQDLLEPLLGSPLQGWISPRGTPSAITRRLLADAGFRWHGDCYDRDRASVDTSIATPIVAMPLVMEVNDLPVYMRHGNSPRAFFDVFAEAFQAALELDDAGHVDITVHAHVFGRPFGVRILEDIIREVLAHDDVWVGTKTELADWVLDG